MLCVRKLILIVQIKSFLLFKSQFFGFDSKANYLDADTNINNSKDIRKSGKRYKEVKPGAVYSFVLSDFIVDRKSSIMSKICVQDVRNSARKWVISRIFLTFNSKMM